MMYLKHSWMNTSVEELQTPIYVKRTKFTLQLIIKYLQRLFS